MRFNYKATTNDGKAITGSAEATNRAALIATLRKQNVHPILIEPAKKTKGFRLLAPKKKIKLLDLVIFTRQLSTMISAGVTQRRNSGP